VRRVSVAQHLADDAAHDTLAWLGEALGFAESATRDWLARHLPELDPDALARPAAALPRSLRRVLGVLAALQRDAALYLVD